MNPAVSTESRTNARKRLWSQIAVIIATALLVVGVVAIVLHQANSFPSNPSTKTNIEQTKRMDASPLIDGKLLLNEDNEDLNVAKDSCWWPTCKWADCAALGGQTACVQRCQQHGLAACRGKCCQIGAPPPPPPGPSPPARSPPSTDCNTECKEDECGYSCDSQVSCYKACVGGSDCSANKCCGKYQPAPPPPPGPVYTWWTIGGTTTDQWCTNNCPDSRNPHCGDGIWCCGGTTHTEQECKKIKADRLRECGIDCCRRCFYLDHTGVCSGCPSIILHPICKRKLW